eukprot:4770589-Amphidinium_carterae.1
MEEYNQLLAYFDKKCAVHFARPNRRQQKKYSKIYIAYHNYQRCRQDERLSQYKKKRMRTTWTTLTRDQQREHQEVQG